MKNENTTTTTTTNERKVVTMNKPANLKNAAARRYYSSMLREALTAAVDGVAAGNPLDLTAVEEAASALADALTVKKNGVTVTYKPVAAAMLYAAAVTVNRAGKYDVKGEGFLRGFCKNDSFARVDSFTPSICELTADDYKGGKKPAAKKPAAVQTPLDRFASHTYSAAKAAAKAAWNDVEKPFTFPTFGEWYTDGKRAAVTAAFAVMNAAA